MIVPLPYSHTITPSTPTPKNTVKIGVYGTYKKGFHNHEMLGKDAKFLGMSKIKGVMYLVDGPTPFPLFYIDSAKKTLEKEYILEQYEIEGSDFQKIQSKEIKENGKAITVTIDKEKYTVFVTNKKDKDEPEETDRIDTFNKIKYEANFYGPVEIYAINVQKAEEQIQEIIEKAAETLETENHEEAALILNQLQVVVYEKKETKEPSLAQV